MNENDLPSGSQSTTESGSDAIPPLISWPNKNFFWWLQKFLACNPFYLVSAAMLLFGCYRISVDVPLLSFESARLAFNYSAVEIYELALVLTAIFLCRRKLWYDSTLLVVLESLMLFVPFIMISNASLTDTKLTQAMCAVGVLAALIRFGELKIRFPVLNLPAGLLVSGAIFLAANVALPLAYRHFAETKFGVHMDYGPAYEMNECAWALILPVAAATAIFLPRKQVGGALLPQSRWLPPGMFLMWLAVTGVHLYAINYVYEYDLRSDLFAPLALVLAWNLSLLASTESLPVKKVLNSLALFAPLLAATPTGIKYFPALAGANLIGYLLLSLTDRTNQFLRHLCVLAAILFLAGLPVGWLHTLAPGTSRLSFFGGGLSFYLVALAAWLRNPKLALLGATALGILISCRFHHLAGVGHWALQASLLFVLLHSLRWDNLHQRERILAQVTIATVWVIHSTVWVSASTGHFWMPMIPGLLVLSFYVLYHIRHGYWDALIIPISALVVILSGPCSAIFHGLRSAPIGLLAVIGSFVLLGIGTVAALSRHLWHKH